MQLRTKLPVVTIAAAVIPMLLVLMLFGIITSVTQREQATASMETLAELQAEYMEGMFRERAVDTAVLSQLSATRKLLNEGQDSVASHSELAATESGEMLLELMRSWQNKSEYIARISLVSETNRVLLSSDESSPLVSELTADNLRDMKYNYQKIAYVSVDALTGEPILLLAQPMIVDNDFAGCVLFHIRLAYFEDAVNDSSLFDTSCTAVLDDEMQIVVNSGPSASSLYSADGALADELQLQLNAMPAQRGAFTFTRGSTAYYAYYYRFANNWVSLCAVQDSELGVGYLYIMSLACTGLLLLLFSSVLIYRFVITDFIRPMDSLNQAIERINADSFDTRVPDLGKAEFGNIAAAFNRMMNHIRADRRELARREERQRIANEQSNSVVMEYSLDTLRIESSPNAAGFAGYPDCLNSFPASFAERVVAEADRDEFLRLFRTMCEGCRQGHMDLQLLNDKDELRWFRVLLTTLIDDADKPLRIIIKATDVTLEKEEIERLSTQAKADPLTGLLNKGATQNGIEEYLAARADDEKCALILLDVDRLKQVNDTYGHMRGDRVIADAGKAIAKCFRAGDIVGRVGGDEFMVLLRGIPTRELVTAKLEQLQETLHGVVIDSAESKTLTASIGVAVCPDDGDSFRQLYTAADDALYRVKRDGRNSYGFYQAESPLV